MRGLVSRALLVIAAGCVLSLPAQAASTFKRLHAFCSAKNCADGYSPYAGLLMDAAGNLYGTTELGGANDKGVVFKLAPNADKSKYTEHVLKNFCKQDNCTDGGNSYSDLILDAAGNLYGTAAIGGKYNLGVVFRLAPSGSNWTYTVLHSFSGSDGLNPNAGLTYAGQSSGAPWDGSSPLYGTANHGGQYDNGVAYQLVHSGKTWPLSVIHDFQSSSIPGPLALNSAGDLFGTTLEGGKNGGGLMFKVAHGTWKETLLHSFCNACADGSNPSGRLLIDAQDNVFGTTLAGGDQYNSGVVFERVAGGTYKVIHTFHYGGVRYPVTGVIMDEAGNLFGTALRGGQYDGGAIFELIDRGGSWSEATLYSFCAGDCSDGAQPWAPLIVDASGFLYGTTTTAGHGPQDGTVFRLAR